MLVLGHIGYSVAAASATRHAIKGLPLDLRLIAAFALLPDVFDRFLYAFVVEEANSGRLFAHTLIFNIVLTGILWAIRRDLWIYGVVSACHLLLDSEGLSLHQAFWPLLGFDLNNVHIGHGAEPGPSFGGRLNNISKAYLDAGTKAVLLDVGGFLALLVTVAFEQRKRITEDPPG